ncbi:DgyrCDS4621 [Dimorphilus gyrociliatus]|uniref:DgyrCDS4621 n=1 Tax=Dimorphilus gyrociliatus TaxID=2664684 RepID=A0A7I8VIY2_9ANNE|nr:DgyrCDS4621 [Dimorphilus gyrociliatus]
MILIAKIIAIFAFLIASIECDVYLYERPINTAVYTGERTQLNCTIRNDTNFDYTAWDSVGSHTGLKTIAHQDFISPEHLDHYEIVDTYNLVIKSVNSNTTGSYHCTAYAHFGQFNEYLDVYLMSMDETSTCADSQHESLVLPEGYKMAFCFTNFAGTYPPIAEFDVSGDIMLHSTVHNNEMVGGCAVVANDTDFNCSLIYRSPPKDAVFYEFADKTSPNLTTTCQRPSDNQPTVPDWLLNSCKNLFEPPKPTIVYRPTNVAVLRGERATMNCTGRHLGTFHTIRWDYKASNSDSAVMITINDYQEPSTTALFTIFDTYNLDVSFVNRTTSGQFQCDAYDQAVLGTYNAFLLEMESTPRCFKKNYTELESLDRFLRVGFCLNGYSGTYPPTATITGDDKVKETFTFGQDFLAGACAPVFVGEKLNCSMKFGAPPSHLWIFDNVDKSEPELTTHCDEEITDDSEMNVPQWLVDKCAEAFFPQPQEVVQRPNNTAVATGTQNVVMKCETKNFRNMDSHAWGFAKTAVDLFKVVSAYHVIFPEYYDVYGINGTWDLITLTADEKTSGIYQCYVHSQEASLDEEYYAFLLTLDPEPFCTEKIYPELDNDKKIAFCMTNFTGVYGPVAKISAPNGEDLYSTIVNGSLAGSCALIGKGDHFTCEVSYNAPPKILTDAGNYDTTAPDFTTTCSSANGIGDSSVIPSWLEQQCVENYGEPGISKSPKNTAVFSGEPTTLDCQTKGFGAGGTSTWVYAPRGNLDDIAVISVLNYVTDSLEHLFGIEGKWNLKVSAVNFETVGLYECYAADIGFEEFMAVYLMEMEREPSCVATTDAEFPNMKLAFCMTNYSGAYPPNFEISSNNENMSGPSFSRDKKKAGSCAMIEQSQNFNCKVKFGAPPPELLYATNHDLSAPDLTTNCNEGSSSDQIPQWLLDDCKRSLQATTTQKPGIPVVLETPKNTAVKRGEDAKLNCTVRNFPQFGYVMWSGLSTNLNGPKIISIGDLLQGDKEIYELEDTWNLIIKGTNVNSTGLYECYILDTINPDEFHYVHLVEMEEEPQCFVKSHSALPNGQKFAMCVSEYSGHYAPTVNISVDNSLISGNTKSYNGQAGSCAVVNTGESFLCEAKFGTPPIIIDDLEIDTSAPELTTEKSCNAASDSTSVPSWLFDECINQNIVTTLPPPEMVERPTNLAVIEGENATLRCQVRYFSEFGALQWTYQRSLDGDVFLLSNNADFLPGYEDLFSISGTYNLVIKKTNNQTAGLYLCTAFDRDIDGYFMAFLSSIEKDPTCTVAIPPGVPLSKRLAICFTRYNGGYAPDVNITGVGNSIMTKTLSKDFVAGSCALIDDTASFSCQAGFGTPPTEVLVDPQIDTSAPSLRTSCSLSSNPANAPQWLIDDCKEELTPKAEVVERPLNKAVIKGQPSDMKCTVKNFGIGDYVSWNHRLLNLNTRVVSIDRNVMDEVKDSYTLNMNNLYDLNIKNADETTAGYYECFASAASGISATFTAFFNTLDASPICAHVTATALPANKRIAFCYSEYSALWSPGVSMSIGGVGQTTEVFTQSTTVGGCIIISEGDSFSCGVKYGKPPSELLLESYYDDSAPQLTTSCLGGSPNQGNLFIDKSGDKRLIVYILNFSTYMAKR